MFLCRFAKPERKDEENSSRHRVDALKLFKTEIESLMWKWEPINVDIERLVYCEWESRPCHECMHGMDTFQSFGRPVTQSSISRFIG